jgi:hypothetical protein
VPAVHSISTRVWFGLETSIVALFTMEYASRCVAWSNTWSSLLYWMFCKSRNNQSAFTADLHFFLPSFLWCHRSSFCPTVLLGADSSPRYSAFAL